MFSSPADPISAAVAELGTWIIWAARFVTPRRRSFNRMGGMVSYTEYEAPRRVRWVQWLGRRWHEREDPTREDS